MELFLGQFLPNNECLCVVGSNLKFRTSTCSVWHLYYSLLLLLIFLLLFLSNQYGSFPFHLLNLATTTAILLCWEFNQWRATLVRSLQYFYCTCRCFALPLFLSLSLSNIRLNKLVNLLQFQNLSSKVEAQIHHWRENMFWWLTELKV